ncbi:hypothetical protein [Neptunomonas antarctica]|uniref:Uncharacterized protein n=1 Tax=Neptunomonas antarctica TaxID=619304 RepID=A0A1N7L4W1_9GAMM|nr:hypothetical protein [Neptunomonas antarctica]SIS68905.1 hypothetical protein SAMN05421760_103238 [Neptunomonas antarctica]
MKTKDFFVKMSLFFMMLSGMFFLFSSNNIQADVDYKTVDDKALNLSEEREVISDAELDLLRGGFALPNGLIVDFSFDKRIYQNGVESFFSYFELPEGIQFSRDSALSFSSAIPSTLLHSVTQNSLDNQLIRTINTINIDISNFKNAKYNANPSEVFRNYIGPTFR